MRLRRLIIGLIVVTGVFVSVSFAQKVTLQFPSWQATEPGTSDWWKDVINRFEQEHPNVTVNFYSVPYPQYVNKLTAQFAAGTPPDIVHLPSANLIQFAAQGWLEPLDSRLSGTNIPSQYIPLQKDAMSWKGQTYGLLLLGYGNSLYYNEQLLQKAGVAVPKTPGELLNAIEKINDPTNGVYGIAEITAQNPNIYMEASDWVMGEGQTWTKNGSYDLTNADVVKAVNDYRKSLQYAPAGTTSEAARQLFINGKAGFIFQGPWMANYISQASKDIQPNLKGEAVPFPVTVGGASNNLSLPKDISPDKQKLVWDFMQLVASPWSQELYATVANQPPPRKGAVAASVLAKSPFLKLAVDAASVAHNYMPAEPTIRSQFSDFTKTFNDTMLQLKNSSTPTSDLLASLQKTLQSKFPLQ